jgi:flagellar motility protein MotE (MotC chaperone)
MANTGGHAAEPAAEEGAGAECPTSDGVLAMLAELQAREKSLQDREAIQAERDQILRQAEVRLEQRLAELVATEEKLAQTVSIADTAAEKDVSHLVALYENMKPKDAAPLFEEMAPDFAAGFLARMRPDAAAALLAALNPKTGYTISVLMAGRNANAPKD